MTDCVVALLCPDGKLNDLVRSLEAFDFMIAERRLVRDSAQDFCVRRYTAAEDFASWDEGRLFRWTCELHWVRREGSFHVVAIGNVPVTPQLQEAELDRQELGELVSRATRVLLWGIRDSANPGAWWQARIPRTFSYPLTAGAKARPWLEIVEYTDPASEAILWWRCAALTSTEEVTDA